MSLKYYTYKVAANAEENVHGRLTDHIRIAETTAPFEIAILNEGSFYADKGLSFNFPTEKRFDHFRLVNNNAFEITCSFWAGSGATVTDDRLNVTGGSVNGSMGDLAPATITTTSGIAVNIGSSRAGLILHNEGTSKIFFGGSGVSASSGIPLSVGQTIILDSFSGDLHAVTASGTAILRAQSINIS